MARKSNPKLRMPLAVLLAAALILAVGLGAVGCRPQLAGTGGDTGGSGGDTGSGGSDSGGSGGNPPPPPPSATAACPLCGIEVKLADVLHRPIAVAIDNLDAARPQSGLNDACLIYEVLAEGGITRFVAFFLHNESASIGPVRSLRPYFFDLAMPLGAPIAHVGGSPAALKDVADLKPTAMSIDQMAVESAFWRLESRKAPHNVYTSTSALRKASLNLGYEGRQLSATTPAAFAFAPAADKVALPNTSQSVSRFTVNYAAGAGNYAVTYDYDAETALWMRYVGGSAQTDAATGKQLRAVTVIVQYVSSWTIPGDAAGRVEVSFSGSGKAEVFTLGKTFDAEWSKPGRAQATMFTDSFGNPLTLPPGPMWVIVVPPGSRLDTQ